MSVMIKKKFGIDVFDDHEISINLLVGDDSSAISFNVEDLKQSIEDSFHIIDERHTIIAPGKEEDHSYQVKITPRDQNTYFIDMEYLRSYTPKTGEEFLKDISMSSHPRLVAMLLQIILKKFPNEGMIYGMIEIFFIEINRDILNSDLSKFSDNEISDRLFSYLPSDHFLYKINQGGWVDDQGNMHEYTGGS